MDFRGVVPCQQGSVFWDTLYVAGKVEIKGVVRCYNESFHDSFSYDRRLLNINIDKVDTVIVSNFFIKDMDDICDINFTTHGSTNFIMKDSKLQKNVTGQIVSESCVKNDKNVPCSEVFVEYQKLDYTVKIVMSVIGLLGIISFTVIVSRVPF